MALKNNLGLAQLALKTHAFTTCVNGVCFNSTNRLFQNYVNPSYFSKSTKKAILYIYAIIGGVATLTEISFYITIYYYLTSINKKIGGKVLKQSVIKERNQRNAVSFSGQMAGCVLEFSFVFLVGIFNNLYDAELAREITPILKHFTFLLVPLIQILTTPPLKAFMNAQ